MKLTVFTEIIETIQRQIVKGETLNKLGVDVIDYEEGWIVALTIMISVYYGKEGGEWIGWYLYERPAEEPVLKAFDSENNEICFDIPSLWKHIEGLRVSTDFKEYDLPKKTSISESDIFRLLAGKK